MNKQIADLTIHYFVEGNGHPLLLLHGGGARAQCFEEMLPILGTHFQVYAFDQRGFGSTRRPAHPELSWEVWREDALRFLDSFGIERAVIAGWSVGAATAINIALAAPHRVSHLILIGAGSGPGISSGDRSGFDARRKLIESGASQQEIVEKTFEFTKKSLSADTLANKPHVVEKIRHEHLANDPRSYLEMLRAFEKRPAVDHRLSEIRCPTLIVCGDEDTRTPLPHSVAFNRRIEASYLKVIPNCGHHYGYEQPEATSRAIIDFVKAFDSTRSR